MSSLLFVWALVFLVAIILILMIAAADVADGAPVGETLVVAVIASALAVIWPVSLPVAGGLAAWERRRA